MAFSFFGLWSNQPIVVTSKTSRSIASDCESLVQAIINPSVVEEKIKKKMASNLAHENILKFRNTIWNKIITSKDFENFNDQEYFRWIEIYKDTSSDLNKINPVSIEQKLAIIEVINARLIPKVLESEKNISIDAQKLSAHKLKKLQTHLHRMDLTSKVSRENLDDFAADLMIILKGPPVSLLDYFTLNKTKRMSERLARTVQEDMLVMGLKGIIARIPEKESYTRAEKAKYLVKRILQYKIWRFVTLPYDLPWIDRVRVPDELMEKILLDGLDNHNEELIAHLKSQDMIDHYERFRQVYRPIAFSLGFYFYYDQFSERLKGRVSENQEEEKRRLLEDFKNLADHILVVSEMPVQTADILKKEQIERVLQAFREKYKEDPTPKEYEEMHDKIFGKMN